MCVWLLCVVGAGVSVCSTCTVASYTQCVCGVWCVCGCVWCVCGWVWGCGVCVWVCVGVGECVCLFVCCVLFVVVCCCVCFLWMERHRVV